MISMGVRAIFVLAFFRVASLMAGPDDSLVGDWPLMQDGADRSANGREAVAEGIDFTGDGARFDGARSSIRLPGLAKALGSNDFTIEMSIRPDDAASMPGDLFEVRDANGRGVSISIVTRAGVTHSQANVRQLSFEICSGSDGITWKDAGRPGNAVYVHALCVHDGAVYAGTCEPAAGEFGHVYRRSLDGDWIDLGHPDDANAVISLASFAGALYAGTGKYRLAGSALTESPNDRRGGRIYRFDAPGRWSLVGDLEETDAVGGMCVYRDRLFVSSLYRPARLRSLGADGAWQTHPLPEGEQRVESMVVYRGLLYATSYDNGNVYRFDGESWESTGPVADCTQTYGFAIHRGDLFVSGWPNGRVFRYRPGLSWEDVGRLGDELEVMGMAVYNGSLFGGTLPSAAIYQWMGGDVWKHAGTLDQTPAVKYRRAWSMAVADGSLYVGTLPSGRVHIGRSGACITWDREFPMGGHHLAAGRSGSEIVLWVDGVRVASQKTDEPKVDLSEGKDAVLGSGPYERYAGTMRGVRLYRRLLTDQEIEKLAEESELRTKK